MQENEGDPLLYVSSRRTPPLLPPRLYGMCGLCELCLQRPHKSKHAWIPNMRVPFSVYRDSHRDTQKPRTRTVRRRRPNCLRRLLAARNLGQNLLEVAARLFAVAARMLAAAGSHRHRRRRRLRRPKPLQPHVRTGYGGFRPCIANASTKPSRPRSPPPPRRRRHRRRHTRDNLWTWSNFLTEWRFTTTKSLLLKNHQRLMSGRRRQKNDEKRKKKIKHRG